MCRLAPKACKACWALGCLLKQLWSAPVYGVVRSPPLQGNFFQEGASGGHCVELFFPAFGGYFPGDGRNHFLPHPTPSGTVEPTPTEKNASSVDQP